MKHQSMKRQHWNRSLLVGAMVVAALAFTGCIDQLRTTTEDNTSDDDNDNSSSTTVTTLPSGCVESFSGEDWDSSEEISLQLDQLDTATAQGWSLDGAVLTISQAGTYRLSGTFEGSVQVDSEDNTIRLILDGVEISSQTSAALTILQVDLLDLVLAEGSVNTLTDASTRAEEDEANAALYSKSDLLIRGTGQLVIEGKYNDAIAGKDGLVIQDGVFAITSVDDGIRGKDYLNIEGGVLAVEVEGDALKSTNGDEEGLGVVCITDGDFDLFAGGDGITGVQGLFVAGGDFNIEAGGGYQASLASDASAKGLKSSLLVKVSGGSFVIDAAEDGIHSDDTVEIVGGNGTITAGDDGIHAESTLSTTAGSYTIANCYEGLEAYTLELSGGFFEIYASDDGINGAGGMDSSGETFGGHPGHNQESSGGAAATISGGTYIVESRGDGLDVNGDIEMSDGTVIIHGPTDSGNGPIDYDSSFDLDGGFFVAVGSSGMAQAPSTSSNQRSVLVGFDSQSAGTLLQLQRDDGEVILVFELAKSAQSLLFSSADLYTGSYDLYRGGSGSGESMAGLYEGSASLGSILESLSVSSMVTQVNLQGGFHP